MNARATLKLILLYALSPLGRLIYWIGFRREMHSIFLILPHYHVAGAEMIHVQIAESLKDEDLCIVFTRRSPSKALLPRFSACGRIVDLSGWEENPVLSPIAAGLIAQWANSRAGSRLFSSNSFLFFKVLHLVRSDAVCIDLTHSFDGGVEIASLPVAERLDLRIVIHGGLVQQFRELYRLAGLGSHLLGRLVVIVNRTGTPARRPEKAESGRLLALYVGRSTPEKRAHLVALAASKARLQSEAFDFAVAGRFEGISWPAEVHNHGEVADRKQMLALYRRAHVVLLTSSREGMPLAIIEGMAHGAIPICTPVGDLPNHVLHYHNGILLQRPGESEIVEDIVSALQRLQSDRRVRAKLAARAFEHAQRHFAGSSGPEYRKAVLEAQRAA